MSIHKKSEGMFEIRWRQGGRHKSLLVHGGHELARKVERKKMSVRDENRHLDIKREVNFRMSALIDKYWTQYGIKKRSADREKSIVEGIRSELGKLFVREVDGNGITRWYENLMIVREVSPATAVRHFNVMHHMMKKAATIWSKETGIDRIPPIWSRSDDPMIRETVICRKASCEGSRKRWMRRSIARARTISTKRSAVSG